MNAKQKKEFIKQAVTLSLQNAKKGSGGPFGAVVVRNGKVIAKGSNLVTSQNDPTAHAEVIAIRRSCQKLKRFHLEDCVIFSSCEPCPMCLAAIYWSHIPVVYFANSRKDAAKIGFDDELIYQEIEKKLHQRQIKFVQIKSTKAKEVFKYWQDKPDKILY